MKRNYMILYIFLTLGIIVVIISIYITKENLKFTIKKEGLQMQNIPHPETKTSDAAKQQEAGVESQELEFENLEQFSDDYVRDKIIETEKQNQEAAEESTPAKEELSKQPSWQGLKELKSKGAVIY